MAGNAAGIAGLFTEEGTATFFGFPTTTGRAAIEALMAGLFSAVKVTASSVSVEMVAAPAPGLGTALGMYAETVDSSGVTIQTWYHWAGSYRQDADGQWRFAYLMSFPDSTKR